MKKHTQRYKCSCCHKQTDTMIKVKSENRFKSKWGLNLNLLSTSTLSNIYSTTIICTPGYVEPYVKQHSFSQITSILSEQKSRPSSKQTFGSPVSTTDTVDTSYFADSY